MAETYHGRIIRRSLALLILRIFLLQLIVIAAYLLIRLPKTYILSQLLSEPDYHHLNFWLGIIVFLGIIITQTVLLAVVILRWANEYYVLGQDTIIHTQGVFTRHDEIYSLKTIEAASVQQTLLGKLLNFGTVKVYSPVLKKEYFLQEIPSPYELKDVIMGLLSDKGVDEKQIVPREIEGIR